MAGFRTVSTTLPGGSGSLFTPQPTKSDILAALLQRKPDTDNIRHPTQVLGKLAEAAAETFVGTQQAKEAERITADNRSAFARSLSARDTGIKEFRNPDDPSQVLIPGQDPGRQAMADVLLRNEGTFALGADLATRPALERFEDVDLPGGGIGQRSSTTNRLTSVVPGAKPRGLMNVAPGATVFDPTSRETLFTAPKSSSPTPAQQADNREIFTSRDQLQSRVGEVPPGLTPREVIQGEFESAARRGTAPPPFLEQAMRRATQHAVGDDPLYTDFIRWLDTRTPETPVPPPEPKGPGFVSRTFDRIFGGDDEAFDDRLGRIQGDLDGPGNATTDSDVLVRARDAIARGAPRAEVEKRLREAGIETKTNGPAEIPRLASGDPDPSKLISGQVYEADGKRWRWTGANFVEVC